MAKNKVTEYLGLIVLYIWEVIKETFPRLERGEFLVGTIIPISIIAFGVTPVVILGITVGFSAKQWAFGILIVLAIILVVITPARIGIRYLRSLHPELIVEKVAPRNRSGGGREWGLVVHNIGLETATGVRASLEDIDFEVPHTDTSLSGYPKRSLSWPGQGDRLSYEIGSDHKEQLNVIYRTVRRIGTDRGVTRQSVEIAYHASDEEREAHALIGDEPVLLLINLVSEGRRAFFIVCRADVGVIRQPLINLAAQIRSEQERQPLEIIYQGKKRPSLDSFKRSTLGTEHAPSEEVEAGYP